MSHTARVRRAPDHNTPAAATTTAMPVLNAAAPGLAIANTPPHGGRARHRPVASAVAVGYVLVLDGTTATTQALTVAMTALGLTRLGDAPGACVPCDRATSAASWLRCPSRFPPHQHRRHREQDQHEQPACTHEPTKVWPGRPLWKCAGRLSGRQYSPPSGAGHPRSSCRGIRVMFYRQLHSTLDPGGSMPRPRSSLHSMIRMRHQRSLAQVFCVSSHCRPGQTLTRRWRSTTPCLDRRSSRRCPRGDGERDL